MTRIQHAAKTSNISVVLGFSENDGGNSIYIAQCIISSTGNVVMKRRKFKPTHMERTVFGDAGGESLKNVVQLEGVGRVGALNCWEHMQPLVKYHTMSLREEIHVAAWPPLGPFQQGSEALFSMTADGKLTLFLRPCLLLFSRMLIGLV
jgi:predicted amidohydrolase